MLKELAQLYLANRTFTSGQTIQIGWFVFRIANEWDPPEIETLDFKRVASFTSDFSEPERIHRLQSETLKRVEVTAEECTLRDSAVVSRSYSPFLRQAFLCRQSVKKGSDSGWYVGVAGDQLDLQDPGSFVLRSLYELSIADPRMFPFWLLPVEAIVQLDDGRIGFPPSK